MIFNLLLLLLLLGVLAGGYYYFYSPSKNEVVQRYPLMLNPDIISFMSEEEQDFFHALINLLVTHKSWPIVDGLKGKTLMHQALYQFLYYKSGNRTQEFFYVNLYKILAQTKAYYNSYGTWINSKNVVGSYQESIQDVYTEFSKLNRDIQGYYWELIKDFTIQPGTIASIKQSVLQEISPDVPSPPLEQIEFDIVKNVSLVDTPVISELDIIEIPEIAKVAAVLEKVEPVEIVEAVPLIPADVYVGDVENTAVVQIDNEPIRVIQQSELSTEVDVTDPTNLTWDKVVMRMEEWDRIAVLTFIELLNSIIWKVPGLTKGVRAQGWKTGNRLYMMEIGIRELMLENMPPENRSHYKGISKEIHQLSMHLFKGLDQLGWLITELDNTKCMKEAPFWEVQIGDILYKGVFIIDLPESLMDCISKQDTTYPIEVQKAQYLRPKKHQVENKSGLISKGLLR